MRLRISIAHWTLFTALALSVGDAAEGAAATPTFCVVPEQTSTSPSEKIADKPAFVDKAEQWGLTDTAKRAVWGDLDGDGWLDAILDAKTVWMNRANPEGGRHFVDTTADSGLDARWAGAPDKGRPSSFVILGDVDSDGDLDLFSGLHLEREKWKRDPDDQSKPLRDAAGERVPERPDPGVRNAILLNDGQGRFTMREKSGVEAHAASSICAAFFDYDRDGVLDLYVGNWYRSYGWSYEAYPDRLYRGVGDGSFVDVTEAAGLMTVAKPDQPNSSQPTFGITPGDTDGDGDADLLVCSYGRRWNAHWRNNGDGTFTSIGAQTNFDGDDTRSGEYPAGINRTKEKPFRANGNTFDCQLADFDEDGDLDAFVAEITHAWAGDSSDRSSLLVNEGRGDGQRFERMLDRGIDRVHEVERWNQGDLYCSWIDADGDGRQDLLLASGDYPDNQRLRLFQQTDGARFRDATSDAGIDWEGSGAPTIGDVDRDGDPDVLIGRSLMRLSKAKREELGTRPALWINRGGDTGRWATITLRGAGPGGTNTMGIGCAVVIHVGDRKLHRVMPGPSGHSGHQDASQIIVGLGDAKKIDRLEITWANPAGTRTVLKNLPVDHHVTVEEGTASGDGAGEVKLTLEPHR